MSESLLAAESVKERLSREVVRHGVWNLPNEFGLGDLSDDGLERMRRGLSRRIEDAADGLSSPRESSDKAIRRLRHELSELEGEQALRAALRYRGAREDGTHSLADYEAAGGMQLGEDESGQKIVVCTVPPSYPLAFMLDYRAFCRTGVCVLDWAGIEEKFGREKITTTIAGLWLGGIA